MAGTSGIRAGRAFVEFFGETGPLNKSILLMQAKLRQFGAFTSKIGTGLVAGGAGILAPMTKSFTDVVTRGRDIGNLANRYKLTTESVSGLAYAFEQVGSGLDEFTGTIDAFSSKVFAGADGSDDSFRRLGLNARRLINLPLDKQFAVVADRLSRITRESDRAEMAQAMFGSAGLKLLPILRQGAKGFENLAGEAQEAGAIVSAAEAARSQELWKAYTQTLQAVKYAFLEVGAALLGASGGVTELSAKIRAGITDAKNWLIEHRGLIVTAAAVAAGALALGVAFKLLGLAAAVASAGLTLLAITVKLVGVAIALLTSPVGLVIAAVGLLGAAFVTQTDRGRRMVGTLTAGFHSLADTAKQTWTGIAAALKKGDIELAANIGFAGLKVAWFKIELWFTEAWNRFKDVFVDGWHQVVGGIKFIFWDFVAWIGRNVFTAIRKLLEAAAFLLEKAGLSQSAKSIRGMIAGIPSDAEINRGRDAIKDEIWADIHRDTAARKKSRAEAERGVRQKIADAEAALARLRAEALAADGGAAGGAGPDRQGRTLFENIRRALDEGRKELEARAAAGLTPLFSAQKGTFAGPIGQQLGIGDQVAKRNLFFVQQIAGNAQQLPAINQNLDRLNDKMQFR